MEKLKEIAYRADMYKKWAEYSHEGFYQGN